jgi:hypothetical protein
MLHQTTLNKAFDLAVRLVGYPVEKLPRIRLTRMALIQQALAHHR